MQSAKTIKRVYFGIIALFWLATSLPLALLILLMEQRGISLFQIGVAMGIYSLTIMVLELPTGGLADAIGRKKVSLLAYGFATATFIVYLFAFSFPGLLLASVLNGIGRALGSGALDAWFVDSLQAAEPKIDIQPALAQAGTVVLLALSIGTLLGSSLPRLFAYLPADGTAVLTPLSSPLVGSIVLFFLLLLLTAALVKEAPRPQTALGWRHGFRQVPQIVKEAVNFSRRSPILLLLLGATIVGGGVLAGLETFWQPRFADLLGRSDNSLIFGVIMTGSFVVGMVGNLASVPLSRLLGGRYALVAAVTRGLQGLTMILLALQTGWIPAAAFFWLIYLNLGIQSSPHATLVNRAIPAERRSTMLSVQSLASYLGGFLGSALLGLAAERWSIPLAWIVVGALTMVSFGLYLAVDSRQRSHPNHHDPINPLPQNDPKANPG